MVHAVICDWKYSRTAEDIHFNSGFNYKDCRLPGGGGTHFPDGASGKIDFVTLCLCFWLLVCRDMDVISRYLSRLAVQCSASPVGATCCLSTQGGGS